MIRVRFIKNYKNFTKGDISSFSNNEAFGLIDQGIAMVSKDITETDTSITKIGSTKTTQFKTKRTK